MSNRNWNDNELQFARLIHEIDATQNIDWDEVAEQMDLYESEVRELVERANALFTEVAQEQGINNNV
tara:strand:+ start:1132 stop:1332 length:201 start_codon:yes stop_codon:yes gene_type:complete